MEETCAFLAGVGGRAVATDAILTDTMMAQDSHDRTRQVIREAVALAQGMEEQLVKRLIETTPPPAPRRVESAALEGPVVDAARRDDVVRNPSDVDDLLASLGF